MPKMEPLSLAALEWAAVASSCALLSPENRRNADVFATQCGRLRSKEEARSALVQSEAWADFLAEFQYGFEHDWLRLMTRFNNLVAAIKRTEERLTR